MKRPASRPPDLPGYEFVRLLGSGGFSDVFLYEQKLPRRRVAVKVLLTESLTAQTRKQFADEANLMASLSAHPYIVTIFHADVAKDGRPYFVMEYCSGPSLAARYKAAPMGVEETLRVGVRLASAVATAHAAGILHRDIKPANVLINEYGAPSLTDFGISSGSDNDVIALTTTSHAGGDPVATSGTSVGMSIPWSPPEMFGDNPAPDVRSDIFSLAATIYTLLAGHTPFEKQGGSNSQLELAGRIQRGAVTPFSRADIPPSLVAILMKGMDPVAARRYTSATDFARALQGVEIELGYHATPVEIPNMTIARPDEQPDGADETRVRGVATVAAQVPVSPARLSSQVRDRASAAGDSVQPVPRGGPVPVAEDSLESTVVRITGPTVPVASPVMVTKNRGRIIPIVVGSLIATAVIVAGGSILLTLPKPDASTGQNPSSSGASTDDGSPIFGTIKPPVLNPGVRQTDGSVVFTWSNPDGDDRDQFVWWRTDGGEEGAHHPTSDSVATIDDAPANQKVCILVKVNRNGAVSVDAATGCEP